MRTGIHGLEYPFHRFKTLRQNNLSRMPSGVASKFMSEDVRRKWRMRSLDSTANKPETGSNPRLPVRLALTRANTQRKGKGMTDKQIKAALKRRSGNGLKADLYPLNDGSGQWVLEVYRGVANDASTRLSSRKISENYAHELQEI